MVRTLIDRIEAIDWSASEDAETVFSDLAPKVEWVTNNLIPNLWSGPSAADLLVGFVLSLDMQVAAVTSPDHVRSSLALPATLKKYVAAANLRLQEATKAIDGLESKVAAIKAAYDAAERLPATQADLAGALTQVTAAAREAERMNAKSASTSELVENLKQTLQAADQEAQATLTKVRAAYRAATSQGLAQAFHDKSRSLNHSMLLWVLILLASLVTAGLLAHNRFPETLRAVTGQPDWGVVVLNLILGALSVAPAVLVAWVSTKQIGQRFRLAEDYAYKAALSTAYEGYRAEASKLDPLFEAQLFATALVLQPHFMRVV